MDKEEKKILEDLVKPIMTEGTFPAELFNRSQRKINAENEIKHAKIIKNVFFGQEKTEFLISYKSLHIYHINIWKTYEVFFTKVVFLIKFCQNKTGSKKHG